MRFKCGQASTFLRPPDLQATAAEGVLSAAPASCPSGTGVIDTGTGRCRCSRGYICAGPRCYLTSAGGGTSAASAFDAAQCPTCTCAPNRGTIPTADPSWMSTTAPSSTSSAGEGSGDSASAAGSSGAGGAAVGAGVGAGLAIVLVVLAVLFVRRRGQTKEKLAETTMKSSNADYKTAHSNPMFPASEQGFGGGGSQRSISSLKGRIALPWATDLDASDSSSNDSGTPLAGRTSALTSFFNSKSPGQTALPPEPPAPANLSMKKKSRRSTVHTSSPSINVPNVTASSGETNGMPAPPAAWQPRLGRRATVQVQASTEDSDS